MWFQQRDAFTFVQFHHLKLFERTDLNLSRKRFEVIYTWSFNNWIAMQSEKTHEVTRCKQPNIVQTSIS